MAHVQDQDSDAHDGRVVRESRSSFDIDDAFDDDDRGDLFQFSASSAREDMAKQLSSVDLNASDDREPDGFATDNAPEVQPSSFDSQSFHSESESFTEIPLSSSGHGSLDGEAEVDRNTDNPVELAVQEDHVQVVDSYPVVLIDASKTPTHRVTLSTDTSADTVEPSSSRSRSPSPESSRPSGSRHSSPATAPESTDTEKTPSSSTFPPEPTEGAAVASTSTALSEPPLKKHVKRSSGPSALERFRSKTRPAFLPPKSREEDNKHMADWERMMQQSRAKAEKRRKELNERRLAREKRIEDSLQVWQKQIVPDWRVVHRNPQLRKLWWRGIPTKLRAQMWEHAVGNSLALSKDSFRTCSARAKRALAAGTFPESTLELMEDDIRTTLPSVRIFNRETGPMYPDLKDMLCAWVVARSDEGLGYTFGAAKIAAMLLLNMAQAQAFVVMRNLLERHCLRSLYAGESAKADVEAYYRIFDTLLADGMPKIYFNFKQHQISPAAYFPEWLVPLFLDHLPFEASARLWDVIMLEGDSFLYRAALGILAVLEPRLFFPDRKELLELLRGENKAAIEVAKREGRDLDGGKYEIYGVDEETLWDRIDSMEDWWKESTWTRLIQRELPDL